MTPTIKPTPTICKAKSFEIPKRLHTTGTKRREAHAIPEAPQAEMAETTLRIRAVAKSTSIPKVVTDAPAMLII